MVRQFDSKTVSIPEPRPASVFPVKEVSSTVTNPALIEAQKDVQAAVGKGILPQEDANKLVKWSNDEVVASAVLTNQITRGEK